MKFIVSTGALLKQLSTISGVISSNPMVPILENFLFELKEGVLQVTASDLQISIVTTINVEMQEPGMIAVPARMMIDTLKNLPEQPVSISVNHEEFVVEIISDNGRYKLSGENAIDFPVTPEITDSSQLSFSSDILVNAIGYTLFATSNDEMKQAMNGVYFQLQDGYTNFVSSDSHRLIRYTRRDVVPADQGGIIIHKKAMQILKNTLPSEETDVTVQYNASNAFFQFGAYKLICRLIEERFPDYENVIPLDNPNHVTLNRDELLRCLKRLVIYANKSTNQVKFKITGTELQVSAEDLDFSNEASERLYCDHEGDDLEIGFNAKFLIEVLSNLHSEKIMFKLSDPSGAGLIVPLETEENEEILMLVMPIMLHNYV